METQWLTRNKRSPHYFSPRSPFPSFLFSLFPIIKKNEIILPNRTTLLLHPPTHRRFHNPRHIFTAGLKSHPGSCSFCDEGEERKNYRQEKRKSQSSQPRYDELTDSGFIEREEKSKKNRVKVVRVTSWVARGEDTALEERVNNRRAGSRATCILAPSLESGIVVNNDARGKSDPLLVSPRITPVGSDTSFYPSYPATALYQLPHFTLRQKILFSLFLLAFALPFFYAMIPSRKAPTTLFLSESKQVSPLLSTFIVSRF